MKIFIKPNQLIAVIFMLLSFVGVSQNCTEVANFDSSVPGVLAPYGGSPGYFNDYGAPEYVEENCPVGEPGGGLRIKASIDGSLGDGVGYTMTGGINPMPTVLAGNTYHIAGKKLLSNFTMGVYENIVMTIRLSNLTNNGLTCPAGDCAIITEKSLMLTAGMCESWDPPYQFVSPGDFNHMIISVSAISLGGEDDLYIVIDDWCIEEVNPEMCEIGIEMEQIGDCGEYNFFATGDPNASGFVWTFTPSVGSPIVVSGNPANITFPTSGTWTVTLDAICNDGTPTSTTIVINVDADTDPPISEDCPDGETITIVGSIQDGECTAEYVIPNFSWFDNSMIISEECYFDGTLVNPGDVVVRGPGTYTMFCTALDECDNFGECYYDIVIECEDSEACDYDCCLDGPNWPIEEDAYPTGPLGNSNPTGYYPEYGVPTVVTDGCDGSTQSIEIEGAGFLTGEAVGIRNNGTPPIPIFEMGKTYCISYCLKAMPGSSLAPVLTLQASNTQQFDVSCSGSCEPVGTSNVVQPIDGWTKQQIIYTATADFDHLLLINDNNGVIDAPNPLRIDNVCITENPEPIACGVDINIDIQGCGKVVVDLDLCGDLEELFLYYNDGSGDVTIEDTTACIDYPSQGPWTVFVDYICEDLVTRTKSVTFSLPSDPALPILTCPSDTLITLDPEGDCIVEYSLGTYTVSDPTASVACYVSGILIINPSLPVQIPAGVAQVQYIATNECGADTCSYEVEVSCEPVDKYGCPIDFLFIMDNSGSVSPGEYADMETSAMNEIAAISGTYTNSKFGVVHYSGQCGNNISIEHDFQSASGITSINRQFSTIYPGFMDDLNESLDATINALNGVPDADIVSPTTTLNQTATADLYVIIFTDAFDGASTTPTGGCTNSALKPYTNANILKNSFGANISVVHFVPGNADDVGAAIASSGGNYTGIVDANPGDPDNAVLPRQFIAAPFGVPSLDLLDILPPCEVCFDCDDLDFTLNSIDEEACCYSIDIDNGIGTDIVKLEAEILSPDWDFNSTSTNPGLGFTYTAGTTPTNKKVCISDGGGEIPLGVSQDVLEYCFSSTVPSPAPSQTMVFRWYSYNGEFYELECTDTLVTECTGPIDDPCITVDTEVMCNPDNAYVYDLNLTITNNSANPATHVSLNGLPSGYQFSSCTSISGTNVIGIPISGGLAPGATSSVCVRIIAPVPVLSPQNICFDAGIYSFMGKCCHEPTPLCVTLDPCCDPCEDISVSFNPLTLPGQEQCCYEIELNYECDYLFFSKIKFSSQTTGVSFGFHALSNTNFQMCGSSSTELCIVPIVGPLAKGNYGAVMDICMDGINDPSQIPQLIKIDYMVSDPVTNLDTVACSDEATLDCDIVDNKCLEVTNQNLVCLLDSMKYRYTFDVTNLSTIPFNATDVTVFVISPTDLAFVPSGGIFPLIPTLGTNQTQTVTTCLESTTSTFPTTATELILGYRLSYLAGDTCCYESVLDTIPFPPCDPDDGCFSVVDIEAKNVMCDTSTCFTDPFCQPWIIDLIGGGCSPPGGLRLQKGIYNGQPVIIHTGWYYEGYYSIYTCDGVIIQSCGFPSLCNPDAGIDIATDITSLTDIWNCGDAIPVFDPILCSTGSGMSVDYCVKIMNNTSSGQASQIDLQALMPVGMNVSPSTIPVTLPSGGMTTINFTATGALTPGDTVKVKGTMIGNYMDETEYMCMDTLCLPVPECPQDSCCVDEEGFFNNISLGFQVNQLGDCTFEVCANQFDTCHYFGDLAPDWGDGSVTVPQIIQSNPPSNCWQYTYSSSGTYTIKLHVYEGNPADNESCWDADLIAVVEPDCCSGDPCELTDITSAPVSQSQDSCCYDFTIDNGFCDDYFKGIKITVQAPVSISQVQSLNGYVITQLSPTEAEVRPALGNLIPMGTQSVFRLCNTDFNTNPHLVTVSWLVPLPGGGCDEVCPQEFEMECEIDDDDPKCYSFVADSVHCESQTYCFKIKNESMPGYDINSVHLYDLTGSLILSPSGRIGIPTLPQGQTSDWICVQYNGVSPGDNVCYKLSAHNTPVGLPPTQCCTDTIETCFVIPDCPVETCGICPDGSTGGSNLVANGDFEAGNTGFSSGYVYTPTVLMNANNYDVRNSTNLINTQWAAIDHTFGSPSNLFAVFDGPSGNVAYTTQVNVQPNTEYVFCAWVDNLITTGIPSVPVLEIKIGSIVIESGRLLPKTPDGWQLLTYTFNTGLSISGLVDIEITDLAGSGYNDWALDDVSLRSCGEIIVDDCCDDINDQEICDYYDANITVLNGECEGCVTIDLDSCDVAFVEVQSVITPIMDLDTLCFDLAAGTHPVKVYIQRFNNDGGICFEKEFDYVFEIEGCEDTCCELTEEEICADMDSLISSLDYPETCVASISFPLDTCYEIFVDFGDGLGSQYISPNGIGFGDSFPHSYSTDGIYSVFVSLKRYNSQGDICLEKDTTFQLEIVGCGDACCDDLDEQAICDYYDANITLSRDLCEGCVFVDLDSCDIGTVDFGEGPIAIGDNISECFSYDSNGNKAILVNIQRLNANGDICLTKDFNVNILIENCPPPPPSGDCLQLINGTLDCTTNEYCFQVINRTTGPEFNFSSLALVNESTGHSFTPDPIGIPTLFPGDTSAIVCLTVNGAFAGEEVCFDLVGHKEDLAAGEEPTFCCADTVRHCFDYTCDPISDPCCNMTSEELDEIIDQGAAAIITDCQVCMPFVEDSCLVLTIDLGDGNVLDFTGGGTTCHTYGSPGDYVITILARRYNSMGEVCLDAQREVSVTVDCQTPPPICQPDDMTIYNMLTPNDDGQNDQFVIDRDFECPIDIKVFNRWGQMVWQEKDYKNEWKGRGFEGDQLPDGTYFVIIEINEDSDARGRRIQKFIEIRKSK